MMLPLKRMGLYFLATFMLLLTTKPALRSDEKDTYRVYTPKACAQLKPREPMTLDEAQAIIMETQDAWNSDSGNANWRVLVLREKPGDSIAVPVGTFPQDVKAGMSLSVAFRGQVIVLNLGMKPESLVQTLFHELGHARYNSISPAAEINALSGSPDVQREIDSEATAIKFSLESLAACDEELAYREAAAILEMSKAEPYKSAVAKIANDPIWKRYSKKN